MDSEHNNGAGDAREPSVADVGARLRTAREALRLELSHIAAETRIPLRHLEAIEQGNFEALPSRAYAVGFSRTFAKAVGLDPVVITDVLRGELADGSMRRNTPSLAMEPGDPARLPSAGLAWAAAVAALVLAVGAFAFYNAYFGAGAEPDTLLTPAAGAAPVAANTPDPVTTAASGPVVFTALEQGVWLRLYEEGGARLIERTLALGETVTVPATAADPRINTGRPDALAITIAGKPVAKLSDRPTTMAGVPVSATALQGRSAPGAAASATPVAALAQPPSRSAARPRRSDAAASGALSQAEAIASPAPAADVPAIADGDQARADN